MKKRIIFTIMLLGLFAIYPTTVHAEDGGTINGTVYHLPNNIVRQYTFGIGISPARTLIERFCNSGIEIHLLDENKNLLESSQILGCNISFTGLKPGKYYLELVLDKTKYILLTNTNGGIGFTNNNYVSDAIIIEENSYKEGRWLIGNNGYAFTLSTEIGTFLGNNQKKIDLFPGGYDVITITPLNYYTWYGILRGDSPSQYEGYDRLPQPTLSKIEKEYGYEFIGWRKKGTNEIIKESEVLSTKFFEDNEFEAVFTYPKHTVNFITNLNKGSFNGKDKISIEIAQNTSYINEIPLPTEKTGYQFVGWYEDLSLDLISEEIIKIRQINRDYTYYAEYKKIETYTATFDGGYYGTVTSNDRVIKNYNSTIDNVPPVEADEGYDFTKKWELVYYNGNNSAIEVWKAYTEDEIKNIKIDGDMIFQAIYDRNNSLQDIKYTVIYMDGVGGNLFESKIYKYLSAGTETPGFDENLEYKGYKFIGWTPQIEDTVLESKTYIAIWEKDNNSKENNNIASIIKVPMTYIKDYKIILTSGIILMILGIGISIYASKKKKN